MSSEILTQKERREQIKQDLEKAKKEQGKKDLFLKLGAALVIVVVIAIFGWLMMTAKGQQKPTVDSLGEQICTGDSCPHDHIEVGSAHPPYSTNPPNSGPHYVDPAECKVHTEEVVDERAIHSLEHGAVWISYRDKADTTLANQLSQIVDEMGGTKLLLSPRPANDSSIALTSWGRILKLESFDKEKIVDYIKIYRNSSAAREPLAGC